MMKLRFIGAMVLAVLTAAGCESTEERSGGGETSSAKSASAQEETEGKTRPASDETVGGEAKEALAALAKQPLPLDKKNHDRGEVCGQMRNLAEAANDCTECLDTYVKIIDGEGSERIVDCSAQNLPKVTKKVDKLCKALVDSWKRSSHSNSRAIEAIATQQDRCKDQFDAFVEVAVEKMDAYENAYGDLGAANLIYIERLLEHMSDEQKKKLVEAAKKLEKLAMEKKDRNGKVSERLAEQAKKLAQAAGG